MTWQRVLVVFVAMAVAGLLTHVVLETVGAQGHVRSGAAWFAMAMAAWVVAGDYIRKNLLFGRSFGTWFLGTLATAVIINLLIWRFWPR